MLHNKITTLLHTHKHTHSAFLEWRRLWSNIFDQASNCRECFCLFVAQMRRLFLAHFKGEQAKAKKQAKKEKSSRRRKYGEMPGLNHQAETRWVRSNFRPPSGRSAKSSVNAHSSPSLFSHQRFQHQTNTDLVDLRTDSLTNCFFSFICAEAGPPFKKNQKKKTHWVVPTERKVKASTWQGIRDYCPQLSSSAGADLGVGVPLSRCLGWLSHRLDLLTR